MKIRSQKILPFLILNFCFNYTFVILSMHSSEQRTYFNIPISKKQKSLSAHQSYLVHNCLQNITNSTKSEPLQCVIRPFNYKDPSELVSVSRLICTNFIKRPEWSTLDKDVLALYAQANSPESLSDAMNKKGTKGFIIENEGTLLGVIILRPNRYEDKPSDLQVRRLHANFDATDYKGIGKTLLTVAAVDASLHNIPTLMTTASMPARGFFEKLGWKGNVIQTHYPIADKDVTLSQFQCAYQISKNFKDF